MLYPLSYEGNYLFSLQSGPQCDGTVCSSRTLLRPESSAVEEDLGTVVHRSHLRRRFDGGRAAGRVACRSLCEFMAALVPAGMGVRREATMRMGKIGTLIEATLLRNQARKLAG
jgi:hypothetical protein